MFFKRKIKEEPKRRLYGNHVSSDISVFSQLSIVEKFAMFMLPCFLVFMVYIMLEPTALVMWLKLVISITAVGVLIMLLVLIINLLTGID
jgi:hypothetical protein